MRGGIYVLNFYSAVFVDQLKRGRKTATIRLGDKSDKYERGQVVWVTVGFRHSPREKIFSAVIDDVEVKKVSELSPRDIEHDNPEFRRLEEEVNFLEQIYSRPVSADDKVTVIRFSQIVEPPGSHFGNGETPQPQLDGAGGRLPFLTTWLLESPREPVWEAIYDQERWPEWWRGVEEAEEVRPGEPRRRRHGLADGLEEPAALPGRVRGDDDAGRAAAPDGGGRGRRADRGRALAPLRARRRHRGPLRVERGDDPAPG